ncbi:MAG: winged helix-turn-helix domain-containing protein [Elusimicrobiota bacterium]|nr:winged helix-turn-helix domain-containing protein [Elusimicrobiota bacterium]
MTDDLGARIVVHAWSAGEPLPLPLLAGLESRGIRALSAGDWPTLRKLAGSVPADAVLARPDLLQPRELAGRLRKLYGRAALPVLFLVGAEAAPGTEAALIEGGADDALRLPVDGELLAARLEAAVRDAERWQAPRAWPRHVLKTSDGALALDLKARRCLLRAPDGTYSDLILTRRQLDTLAALLRRPNQPVSWAQLYRKGWRPGKLRKRSRTLVQHVLSLRRKLGPQGRRITAVPGFGYRLSD